MIFIFCVSLIFDRLEEILASGTGSISGERLRGVMGRRKSKRKPVPRRKAIEPLATQFNCPFCNNERSCEVKMDRNRSAGKIYCTVCLESFQTTTSALTEPVDIYNDWVDACEEAN